MAEVVLFHHVCGLTDGVVAFAEELRRAGHSVHTPDLFDGNVFDNLDEGMAYEESLGFEELLARADRAVEPLPAVLVYGGFSMGVVAAEKLVITRPGAAGALFFESCVPAAEFGSWPDGVPLQVHGMDADPFFAKEGDIDAARELVGSIDDGELFVYPGDKHLFTDSSLPSYDADATVLLTKRVLDFLTRL
jgi:dienelactone hydrolase